MTKKESQKLDNIIDEFRKNFSLNGDNEFMIEFAEKNFKEFIDGADNLIAKLNRFTDKKSLKVMLYVYIFGLLLEYVYGENPRSGEMMDALLILFSRFLSEANNKIKIQKEIAENYKYALDKLQKTKWHKYPEDKPKKDGNYLITTIYGHIPEVISENYENSEFNLDAFVIAWAEKPSPYKEKDNE